MLWPTTEAAGACGHGQWAHQPAGVVPDMPGGSTVAAARVRRLACLVALAVELPSGRAAAAEACLLSLFRLNSSRRDPPADSALWQSSAGGDVFIRPKGASRHAWVCSGWSCCTAGFAPCPAALLSGLQAWEVPHVWRPAVHARLPCPLPRSALGRLPVLCLETGSHRCKLGRLHWSARESACGMYLTVFVARGITLWNQSAPLLLTDKSTTSWGWAPSEINVAGAMQPLLCQGGPPPTRV